jgi:hypothetical protein
MAMRATVHLHRDEPLSFLVSLDGVEGHGAWLPKSQIMYEPLGLGGKLSIEVPDWLAREKGLVAAANADQPSLF